jgi:Na+-transporting NADH:ubiquinone oxidoreductase subunit C
MSSGVRSILFAAVLCVGCSLLLTAASTGLQVYQQKNIELDRQKNILKAVGLVSGGRSYSAREIGDLFDSRIETRWVGPEGQFVDAADSSPCGCRIYLHVEKGKIRDYIVPINTRGLWGKIHGYLALKDDGQTIAGFTVYQHSETPGLGGEIEKNWFQKNFVGKKIVDQKGEFVSISIAKGKVDQSVPAAKRANYVDGISGATLTGKYLTAGLHQILSTYEPASIRFRRHRAAAPAE